MAERITFKSLLNLVEKETGLDNKQSDRLVRHWFGIINEGLKKDGRVRVSKFGTFKLQGIAERNGINPITREAMVIPAHTKVVFKSAKNLKETVNKKYNLLEAKPIKMAEKNSEKKENQKDEEVKQNTPTNESNPNTESQSTEPVKNEPPKSSGEGSKIEQLKRKQSDDVRTKIEEKFAKDDFTPTGVMPAKEEESNTNMSGEEAEKTDKVEEKKPDEKPQEPTIEPEKVEVIIEKEKEEKEPVASIDEPKKEEKKSRVGLWIAIAAAVIILILIILFWSSGEDQEEVIAEKPPVQKIEEPKQAPKPKVKKKIYKTPGGEHSVNRGDKLWDLSDEFYRDAYLWPNIYRVNDQSIPNPDVLEIGNIVSVPPLEGTFQSLTANDSVNVSIGFYKAYKAYKKHGNQWAKYYLWVCKKYDEQTFEKNKNNVEQDDARFVKKMK